MTDVDYDRTPIDSSIMIIDTTSVAPTYQLQAVFREVQTRFYIVRAVIYNVNTNVVVLKSEAKYYVKVTNPCLLANQVTPQALADIDYWIKDPAATQTISLFNDFTTTTYGNKSRTPAAFTTGNDLCGSKTYQLYKTYPDIYRA